MRLLLLLVVLLGGSSPTYAAGGGHLRTHKHHSHIITHRYGRYLASRHLRYHHRHLRGYAVAARHEPRFRQFRQGCLYAHGHLERCVPAELRVHYQRAEILPHPAGCPATLFCGCGASIEAFGRSIRNLWLADNWLKFPRAAPADGMAVVWPGRHVAVIRRYLGNGMALLYDANSGGHLTRLHVRRIAGLVVVDPHVGKKRQQYAGAMPL